MRETSNSLPSVSLTPIWMLSKSINTASFNRSSATLPSSPGPSAHRFLHLLLGFPSLYIILPFILADCAPPVALCHVQILFFVNDRRECSDRHIKLRPPLPSYVSYRIPVRQPTLKS